MARETAAKKRNRQPPARLTWRSEILLANSFPPITATLVHRLCPMRPPRVTPMGSLAEARAMVAIWDRSPHSAKNVITKACRNTLRDSLTCHQAASRRRIVPTADESRFFRDGETDPPGPDSSSSRLRDSSISTSFSSSLSPAAGSDVYTSYNRRTPKKANRTIHA